jgi:hypothetical protein
LDSPTSCSPHDQDIKIFNILGAGVHFVDTGNANDINGMFSPPEWMQNFVTSFTVEAEPKIANIHGQRLSAPPISRWYKYCCGL